MKNCEIDWDLAPEWAIAHALFAFCSEISEVWVGEDKWQRLTQDKSFPYGGGGGDAHHNPTRKQFKYETPRPKWVEGELPPVGTVCEFAGGEDDPNDPFDKDLKEGAVVTIIAHFRSSSYDIAVFTFRSMNANRGSFSVEQGLHGCFRPRRTPEQIAAEEREKAIAEMCNDAGKPDMPVRSRGQAAMLYDAGWRKQVSHE